MSRRFRWSKKTYKQANHIARLLDRFMDLPDHMPPILREYIALWDAYRGRHWEGDPLAKPLWWRLDRFKGERDGIPF